MATNVKLPQWGMNMEDGLLVKWLVKEGDTVEKGQPMVEVETSKINSELEAPEAGVVAHIMVPEGTTVDVGTIVVVLGQPPIQSRVREHSRTTWGHVGRRERAQSAPVSDPIRAIRSADRDELVRMRLCLWPDSEVFEADSCWFCPILLP